jgi:hypothetical protein
MPKGVYPRTPRTRAQVVASLRARLLDMSIPEPNSGCWLFTGYVDPLGYGIIAETKHKRIKAHRASYTAFKCEIPAGLDIMHRCDMRCCINPDHLTAGTHVENMADMVRKGRSNSGGRRFRKSRDDANQTAA